MKPLFKIETEQLKTTDLEVVLFPRYNWAILNHFVALTCFFFCNFGMFSVRRFSLRQFCTWTIWGMAIFQNMAMKSPSLTRVFQWNYITSNNSYSCKIYQIGFDLFRLLSLLDPEKNYSWWSRYTKSQSHGLAVFFKIMRGLWCCMQQQCWVSFKNVLHQFVDRVTQVCFVFSRSLEPG